MLNMNIKQLVLKYGGPMQLKNWADILNKLFMSNEKDQKIQERRLELIEKDFVTARIFSFMEVLSNQLFDMPASVIDNLIALIISDKEKSRNTCIEIIKKEISKLIKDCKSNMFN